MCWLKTDMERQVTQSGSIVLFYGDLPTNGVVKVYSREAFVIFTLLSYLLEHCIHLHCPSNLCFFVTGGSSKSSILFSLGASSSFAFGSSILIFISFDDTPEIIGSTEGILLLS
eukprot:GFUD01130432.1.p1 GENE.GFUD01130432.1~~GFUD01130432.1.p1  ORF type:complete len:114 (+),score=4.27 GFUD01130432.1:192-533(+)